MDSFTSCINYRVGGHANKFEWLKVRTNDLFLRGANFRTEIEFQQVCFLNKSMSAGIVEYKRMLLPIRGLAGFEHMLI